MELREATLFTIPERGPEIFVQILSSSGDDHHDVIFPITADEGSHNLQSTAYDRSVPTATILPLTHVPGKILGIEYYPVKHSNHEKHVFGKVPGIMSYLSTKKVKVCAMGGGIHNPYIIIHWK